MDLTNLTLLGRFSKDEDLDAISAFLSDQPSMIDSIDHNQVLHFAASQGYTHIIKEIIRKWPLKSFGSALFEGETALMRASRNGHSDIVQLLLDYVDVDTQDKEGGRTALMHACTCNNFECVRILIEKGHARLDIQDHQQRSALMLAVQERNYEIVQYLVNRGAHKMHPIPKDIEGRDVVSIASQCGNVQCLRLLLERSALFNVQDRGGVSPLSLAVRANSLDCVKLLVTSNTVDIDIPDSQGRTAIFYAAEGGKSHLGCFEYLVRCGADMTLKTKRGQTAYEILCRHSNIQNETKEYMHNLIVKTENKKQCWRRRRHFLIFQISAGFVKWDGLQWRSDEAVELLPLTMQQQEVASTNTTTIIKALCSQRIYKNIFRFL